MKRNIETTIGVVFFLLAVAMILARVLAGCALHNPVPVDPNYPPEPPFSETCADAGPG